METLATLLRPTTLEQFVGQKHLVGPGKPLRHAIEQKHIFSFILWGPPGVGKTTLARMYARAVDAAFYELSAVSAGKDDIRKIIEAQLFGKPKILFLDEIHRFNKAQQDFLLPYVESGVLTLIGATTENPSFEVISALLSRTQVFVLYELTEAEMAQIIARTEYQMDDDARDFVIRMANGDARQALLLLEKTATLYTTINVTTLQDTVQNKYLRYDKKAEEHYNTISAFIKSMRAGDVDAALYYLMRMVESGEDPKFIARRMVVFASEDIGLADSHALAVANDVFRAVETIGYPECSINLAHGVCYLAFAPKNRDSYDAHLAAAAEVHQSGNLPVPMSIRNAPTKLMKDLGYHKGYKMYTDESLLPTKIKGTKFFTKTS